MKRKHVNLSRCVSFKRPSQFGQVSPNNAEDKPSIANFGALIATDSKNVIWKKG